MLVRMVGHGPEVYLLVLDDYLPFLEWSLQHVHTAIHLVCKMCPLVNLIRGVYMQISRPILPRPRQPRNAW